ncbi:tetracycline-efflux transporter [Anaeramoeba ignava]|uniref:Tetracycline-efflux transporter n=1 Tax=Anaeramoeba ignava TaxID=1746090 RepID=A0A9Q0RBB6_ANAIG|nr:tetracycline-efflux transporter [Anaeramoeba ignava]
MLTEKYQNEKRKLYLVSIENLLAWIITGMTSIAYVSVINSIYEEDLSKASLFYGIVEAIYCLGQAFGNCFLGVFSDKFGRKNTFIIVLAGFGLDYLICSYTSSKFLIGLARFIDGLCAANPQTGSSYISDISSIDKFANNMGIFHAFGGGGILIGFGFGFLFTSIGISPRGILKISFLIIIIDLIFVIFSLPESKTMLDTVEFDWSRAHPIGAFRYFKERPFLKNYLWLLFLNIMAAGCTIVVSQFYLKLRFNLSGSTIYALLLWCAIWQILAMGVALKILIQKYGNRKSLILGFVATFSANFAFIVAWNLWIIIIGTLGVIGIIAFTIIQSFFKDETPENEHGTLFGYLSFASNISHMITKYFYSYSFSYFTSGKLNLPQIPYFFASLFALVAIRFAMNLPDDKI